MKNGLGKILGVSALALVLGTAGGCASSTGTEALGEIMQISGQYGQWKNKQRPIVYGTGSLMKIYANGQAANEDFRRQKDLIRYQMLLERAQRLVDAGVRIELTDDNHGWYYCDPRNPEFKVKVSKSNRGNWVIMNKRKGYPYVPEWVPSMYPD